MPRSEERGMNGHMCFKTDNMKFKTASSLLTGFALNATHDIIKCDIYEFPKGISSHSGARLPE